MKKINLMIFDFDGTLVSTGDDLVKSVNYTLNTLNLAERPKEKIIGFVGDGVSKLLERALGEENVKFHEEAMQIFTDYYGRHLLDNTVLYPHVEEVLRNFENKKKVILTNKHHHFTLMIVRGLKIENYFEEIVGVDSTPFRKPDGRVMDYLLKKHGTLRAETVMVGDGVNDILVAKNSGILSCGCLYGLGNKNDLLNLQADYYCNDLLEINSLFN
ncbi:MAG: HAD-IA family hydrolase [Smithella sp.]